MPALMNMISLMSDPPTDLPSIAITQDMLKPIVDSIVSNVGVIIVPAIAIFGILLGVKLVPRLIKHFVH